MPRRKKEETAVTEAAPAKKPGRKPRVKKTDAPAAPTTTTRKPRKKKLVPNFVIQNSVDNGITYESVVEKVQAAIQGTDVTSIDIYVKAEEGKAYYVVNGDVTGSVELF